MQWVFRSVGECAGAPCSLLRLAWQTRFRLNGAYWRWRNETALGCGAPDRAEKRRALYHYARWVWRMGRYM